MSARGPGRGRRAPPSASSRPSAAAASALRAPPARGQRAKPRRRRGPGGRGGPGGRSPGGRARPSDGRRRRSRDPRPGGSPRRGRRPGTPLPPPPPPRPRRWAGQGFLARPAPSGPRLDTPPAAPLGGRRRLLLAPAARVIFREVRAPASWGRAARGRGLGSPRARRGAPSAQGLAPPPPLGGPRETLGSPASPVLGHRGAAGKAGSGPGAAKPDRLGRGPRRSRRSTALGRASRPRLHPLGPPRRRGSGRRPPSARGAGFPGAGAAAAERPARSLSATLFQVRARGGGGTGRRGLPRSGLPAAGPRAGSRERAQAPSESAWEAAIPLLFLRLFLLRLPRPPEPLLREEAASGACCFVLQPW